MEYSQSALPGIPSSKSSTWEHRHARIGTTTQQHRAPPSPLPRTLSHPLPPLSPHFAGDTSNRISQASTATTFNSQHYHEYVLPIASASDGFGAVPMDTTGQVAPPGMKPRVKATFWEDEGSVCFQVEANGVYVARREDNHMINGTKLLNVAGMTRGRRDGILKSEKTRHVVKVGPMDFKGVWIPFDRALDFANKEKITELLYPLFAHDSGAFLFHPTNQAGQGVENTAMAARRSEKQPENIRNLEGSTYPGIIATVDQPEPLPPLPPLPLLPLVQADGRRPSSAPKISSGIQFQGSANELEPQKSLPLSSQFAGWEEDLYVAPHSKNIQGPSLHFSLQDASEKPSFITGDQPGQDAAMAKGRSESPVFASATSSKKRGRDDSDELYKSQRMSKLSGPLFDTETLKLDKLLLSAVDSDSLPSFKTANPRNRGGYVTGDPTDDFDKLQDRTFGHKLPVQPMIDDLQALLDPHTYFQSLDDLEGRIIEQCGLKEIFNVDSTQLCPKAILNFGPGGMGLSLTNEDWCDRILLAIKLLQKEGYCHESATILAYDGYEGYEEAIVRAIPISISQVHEIVHMMKQPDALHSGTIPMAARDLLTGCFCMDRDRLPEQISYADFCPLLLLAFLSYASSHSLFPSQRLWGYVVDALVFESLDASHGPTTSAIPLTFRKQRLQCLDAFVGGPVWIFGPPAPSKPATLDISITQFADLWGPVSAIPVEESKFDWLIALKVDGGVIFQPLDHFGGRGTGGIYGKSPLHFSMHFTKTGSFRKEMLENGTCSDKLVYNPIAGEQLPTRMLPFPSNARLLIGQPTYSVTQTTGSNTTGQCAVFKSHDSPFLKVNMRCRTNLQDFVARNHHRLRPLGTREAVYVAEQLQANFAAGQYVNVGIQKVWRRRQASTYKEMIMEYCSRTRTDIGPILNLNIGLELSICTGNAQRVTLWEALISSYPDKIDTLERARITGDSMMLATYIIQLGKTGLDDQNCLSLFWPYKDGLPDIFELSTFLPTWSKVLSETMTSTCFATMTYQCLTYNGRDQLRKTHQRITRGCQNGHVEKFSESIFQTIINFHPESQPESPLRKGTRLMLCNGSLEMRNTALAFYQPHGIWNRLVRTLDHGGLRAGSGVIGSAAPVHHELLDPQRAGNRVLTTCIMDDF